MKALSAERVEAEQHKTKRERRITDKNGGKKKFVKSRKKSEQKINKSFAIFRWKQFSSAIIHSAASAPNALETIDNNGLQDADNELHAHVFNSRGWAGGESWESRYRAGNESSDFALKVTELLLNLTHARDANFTSASENIKLLSPLNNQSAFGNFSADQNSSNYDPPPHIPDYIRTTSIVFCVVILCLGLIGNIMVKTDKSAFIKNHS